MAVTIFLAVIVISTASLVNATIEYVGFFEAISDFKLQLIDVIFSTSQETLNVTVEFEVSNPTHYSGLYLEDISITAYYEGENHTIVVSPGGPRIGTPYETIVTRWWQLPEGHIFNGQPIPSYSTTHFAINITARGDSARNFYEYFEKQPGQDKNMRWTLGFNVRLKNPTFLKTMELQYQIDR